MRVVLLSTMAAAVGLFCVSTRAQDCDPVEQAKLVPLDSGVLDGALFGRSVAVSGNTVLVGASHDGAYWRDYGAAYVYRYDGLRWSQRVKLRARDAEYDELFGSSVAIVDDMALIGAIHDDDKANEAGSVYVFRSDGTQWTTQGELYASDGGVHDHFGNAIAVSGHRVVIGADRHHVHWRGEGAAYVFRYDGARWVEDAELLPSDPFFSEQFGYSVAISGDTVVVGAPFDGHDGEYFGSAYVFRFDGSRWVQEAKLVASDGAEFYSFGVSVAVEGDMALIGERSDDNGYLSGSVHVFRFDGSQWAEEDKLLPSDGAEEQHFGWRIALSGDSAVILAPGDDDNGDHSGAAYLFRFDGTRWRETTKILASDGTANDGFGSSVASDGDGVVIGASRKNAEGEIKGPAYVFDLGCLCRADLNGDGKGDLGDYALFAGCLAGPGQPVGSGCEPADLDRDGDADLIDFMAFQRAFACP